MAINSPTRTKPNGEGYIHISTNLFQALATQCLAITGGCSITFKREHGVEVVRYEEPSSPALKETLHVTNVQRRTA